MRGKRERVPFTMVANAAIDSDLGTYAKLLYVILSRHSDAEGKSWPSQARLAKMVGCTDRKIREAKAELESSGWLISQRTGRTSVYLLKNKPGTTCRSDRNEVPNRSAPRSDRSTTQEVLHKKEDSDLTVTAKQPTLHRQIQEAFEKVRQEEGYADLGNYAKEGQSIKTLIVRAEKLGDPATVIPAMMSAFLEAKRHGRTEFWTESPFLPSELCSKWNRVAEKARKKHETVDVDDFIAEMVKASKKEKSRC